MAEIIIHAGMPKTGSSSIQRWLASKAERLRRRADVEVLVWRSNPDDPRDSVIRVEPYQDGKINSSEFVHRYRMPEADPNAVVGSMLQGLEDASRHRAKTVSTGEILCRPFLSGDPLVLGGLEDLAKRHRVRVAYYVRPQHTALEAAWRQWGFRSGLSPATYLERRAGHLDYADTLRKVRLLCPSVHFEMRPFRTDLLVGRDIVLDFCDTFLDIAPGDVEKPPAVVNLGVPLAVANVLSDVPPNLLWKNQHDNKYQRRIKRILEGLDVPDTAALSRSKRALQEYCHNRFESANAALFAELGFSVGEFIPAVSSGVDSVSLEMFDEWWRPQASEPELALLYRALALAVAARPAPARWVWEPEQPPEGGV